MGQMQHRGKIKYSNIWTQTEQMAVFDLIALVTLEGPLFYLSGLRAGHRTAVTGFLPGLVAIRK